MWCSPRFNNPANSSKIICSLINLPFKTGYEGRSCSEKNDCGGGYCVYDNKGQKGVCQDIPRGCVGLIDKEGIPKPVCFD